MGASFLSWFVIRLVALNAKGHLVLEAKQAQGGLVLLAHQVLWFDHLPACALERDHVMLLRMRSIMLSLALAAH